MVVTLNVTGNGTFQGSNTNLNGYTVSEDSTPIEGSDSSGGTGQISFGVVENHETVLLLNDTVEVVDSNQGRVIGTVNAVSGTDGVASVTADSRLALLNTPRQVLPYNGNLAGALVYYLSLVGIVDSYLVDSAIASRIVTYPGFNGNLWDFVKQICVVEQIELSLVSNQIVFRPLRTHTGVTNKDATQSWNVNNNDLAQTVEVYYYNNQYITNGLIYPKGGWHGDEEIYTVDAGVVAEFDIEVDVSMTTVQQPQQQYTVPREYVGPFSVYSVIGNDDLPITPAQWEATGGKLELSILPDTKTIHVKLTGSSIQKYAPYRIAVSSGAGNYYSTLRIIGTGVFFDQQKLTLLTGAEASKAPTVIGTTVDNPFVSTLAQAYTVGMKTAGKYAAPSHTINSTATQVSNPNDTGIVANPSFGFFDGLYVGKTFSQWNTLMSGKTFTQFNTAVQQAAQDTVANQSFGNVGGARIRARDSFYRIRTASITESQIAYTAEQDTTFSDHNTARTGMTFSQFNTRYAGKAFQDFDVMPLW